jgi:3'(2'), 5'-bisphosphate nucleotidase
MRRRSARITNLQPLGLLAEVLLIARGAADVYLRRGATSEWDTAAAQCVLEEAGGAVLDLTGTPLRYNRGESLINPEFIASAMHVDRLGRTPARSGGLRDADARWP